MPPVNLVAPDGRVRAVEEGSAEYMFAVDSGWRPETGAEAARVAGEAFSREGTEGVGGAILATGAGIARGVTGGLSDAALGALGGGEYFDTLREERPYLSLGGEVVGALTPAGVPALAARAGERVAGRIAGEGVVRTAARKVTKGAVEGGIQGVGTGVSELALSDDPLTVERIASTLGTGALLGAGIGGGFELAGHGLSAGLAKTSKKLREFAAATPEIVPAPAPEFPGAPKFDELPPAPPPAKRKRPAGAPEPKPRGPFEEREMLVGDLQDVKLARMRQLRAEGKLAETHGRVEEAGNLRVNPPGPRKKLPASHPLNKPIDVVMDADGKMRLVDGYVRLSSLPHDAKIKVRIRRGDASAGAPPPVTADNLADLDSKALREARQAELEALESTRVGDRGPLAEDILSYRRGVEAQKLWLATDGVTERELKKLRKLHLDADKAIERVAKIPKALADNPNRALIPLQAEEHALEQIVARMDDFKATGARAERMAAIPKALEQNRALQKRIIENAGKQTSRRLDAIDEAMARLADKTAAANAAAAGGSNALGVVATLAAPVPVVGQAVVAATTLIGRVAQRTRKVLGAVADRSARAVDKLLEVGQKAKPVLRAAPVVATRVLAKARYGSDEEPRPAKGAKPAKDSTLAELYRKRSSEIRSLTALAPDGTAMMRRDARARVAAQLAAFGAISPLLADRIETLTARKVEFLAGRLPRRPDLAALPTGPDLWQPSDLQMRTWARYVAGVEDPASIEERLADGSITPEDAEVMREVYPERMEALKAEIVSRLPQLQRQLPYHRRLALSIFSGVPVDPAMNPQILRVLQSSFADEPGSEGGTMAPQAMPAFGSVRSQEKPTPAQRRAG